MEQVTEEMYGKKICVIVGGRNIVLREKDGKATSPQHNHKQAYELEKECRRALKKYGVEE